MVAVAAVTGRILVQIGNRVPVEIATVEVPLSVAVGDESAQVLDRDSTALREELAAALEAAAAEIRARD